MAAIMSCDEKVNLRSVAGEQRESGAMLYGLGGTSNVRRARHAKMEL